MSTEPAPTEAADPRDAVFSTAEFTGKVSRQAASGAVITALSTAFKIAVQFGSIAALARLVPPAEFGIAALAVPIVLIAMSLSQFGLAQAIIQRPHVTHRLASALFWVNASSAAIFSLGVAAAGPLAARFYGEPRVAHVFLVMSLCVLCAGLVSPFIGVLRRQMRFRTIETCSMLTESIAAAVAIAAAFMGASYWAVVSQYVLSQAISLLALGIAAKWLPSRPSFRRENWRQARESIAFGGHVAIFGLVTQLSHSMGTVIVGRAYDAALAGVYFRSWTLSNYPVNRLAVPMGGVFIPSLSRLADDPAAFQQLYGKIVRQLSLFVVPMGVLFCSCADLVTALLFGPEWAAAGPILTWLGILSLQAPLANSLNWAMTASGAVRSLMRYGWLSAVMILTALIVGSQFSIVAMSAVYALSGMFVRLPILLAFAVRNTPLSGRVVARTFGPEILIAGGVIFSVELMRRLLPSMPTLAELAVAGSAIAVFYVIRGALDPDTRGMALRVLNRLRRA